MALRRIPSRRMHLQPAVAVPMTWGTRLFLAAIVGGLLAMFGIPFFMLIRDGAGIVVLAGGGFLAFYIGCRMRDERVRLGRLSADRKGESICTFVRRFDCRAFDTWVLRATYEQVLPYAGFPLRPEDRLVEDLAIDPEDLDDLGEEIARLAGRDFDTTENNPWFGRVETVADLCDFMMCQPCIEAKAA